ncbi:Hypothetical protein CINCED_3A016840 [Cinara cedri]|uniref:Uncharacterized protein n=1 Tax=Cinara cedri TaxID=506608 RepID=A0A5E4M3K6_9HEMI|nr:Hypothetical protein CINCED_3A016840 [Cinara cedri]
MFLGREEQRKGGAKGATTKEILFNDGKHQSQKRFKFTINDFDKYHIKREQWYLPTLEYAFIPEERTLIDMDHVFKTFHYPEYPTLNQQQEEPVPKTRHCRDYQEVSPPRRVCRKHYDYEYPQDVIECQRPSQDDNLDNQDDEVSYIQTTFNTCFSETVGNLWNVRANFNNSLCLSPMKFATTIQGTFVKRFMVAK